MHQSNRALLARAYIMQKQVLDFPLLLAFLIFIQITFFTVRAVNFSPLHLVQKQNSYRRLFFAG
jgi:hypothetical protein